MKVVTPRLSYPELRAMPDDGKRYELIDGEVFVAPSPNVKHQQVIGNLYLSLRTYADEKKLGYAFVAPLDVVFGEKTSLQPDIIFISTAHKGIIGPEYIIGAPDLVVEVLSPSRVAFDRITKLEQYAKAEVREYWIIDPGAETAEMYRLASSGYELRATLSETGQLETSLLPGWNFPVASLFSM